MEEREIPFDVEGSSRAGEEEEETYIVVSDEYKQQAFKFLDGQLSFLEYEAVLEEAANNEHEGPKNELEVKPKQAKPRVRRTLPPALAGLMGQANMCFAKGDHKSALAMCLEIVRQQPRAPEPYQTLALIYEESGMKEKSLEFAVIAAYLNPRDPEQWIHLGERSLQQNNIAQAITCYTNAVKYDPNNINAHIMRCQLLEQKGDRKGAVKAYHKLVDSVSPNHGKQILDFAKIAAQMYHEDNDIQKAREVMESGFKKVPDLITSEDVNLYVELLMMLKDYMRALEMIALHCEVAIEGEEDYLEDSETNQTLSLSLRVQDCKIPPNIPIQIHVKLIVILIHLKVNHLLNSLLNPFLEVENVEESGDLYIDIVEALMTEGNNIEALKLLKLLVDSKNYSLPAVWLKYAECLKSLGRLEEAISAYLMVMQQAPQHVEARLMVSELLNELGRNEEAISVLTQDPESGSLDAGLLYERCLLLKGNSERTDEFLGVGRLLLSRHCVRIRKRDDLQPLSKLKGFVRKQEALRRNLDDPYDTTIETELVEGRGPSEDEEWELFLALCKTAHRTKQYALLQRLAFSALGSAVLNKTKKKESDVFFIATLSCYYNKDFFYGYNLARDMILTEGEHPNAWNLFNIMLLEADDTRHFRFTMRKLSKEGNHPALTMLHANNCFMKGTYKYALTEYLCAYRMKPSGLLALMISITMLQMACQKFADKRNSLVTQCIAFLWQYKEFRGTKNLQEVHYNMGRLFHQLGLLPAALYHYKTALEIESEYGPMFDLKREIAYNMSLIYQSSGSLALAKYYTEKYIVI